MGKWPTNAWGQHEGVTTSKWTSLFPGNVLPLENAWPHWQLPYQWHSWSPPLTATTHSQSSTPKPPGRGLVSILPEVITDVLEESSGREGHAGRDGSLQHCCWFMWSERGREVRAGTMWYVSILLEKWAQASTLLSLDFGFILCKMRRQCS